MKSPQILDCSLRDGGYRTEWHFERVRVNSMTRLLGNLEISLMEFGFKFPNREAKHGPFSNVTNDLIARYLGAGLKFGFMIETKAAALFPSPDDFVAWSLEDTSEFSFVRIATTMVELEIAHEMANILIANGKKVFINVMRASELTQEDLGKLSNQFDPRIEAYYLADSFGSLTPNQSASITKALVDEGLTLGFHAHNNRGMALANALASLSAGATYVDGTLAGHGRGSGNAKTEELALELSGYHEKLESCLFDLGNHLESHEYVAGQGQSEASFLFHLGAKKGFHPNTVMKLQSENPTIGLGELLSIIGRGLPGNFGIDPNPEELVRKLEVNPPATDNSRLLQSFSGSKLFLFARGGSFTRDYQDVEHFIDSQNMKIGILNGFPPPDFKADAVFALHAFRGGALTKLADTGRAGVARVCSFARPRNDSDPASWFVVPAKVNPSGFFGDPKLANVGIPSDSVLAFALGTAGLLGVEEVCLGGFDTHISAAALEENKKILESFADAFPKIRLTAIGRNPYQLNFSDLW